MDDLMKRVIEDYFGEPMPENINLSCPTTLHDCIEIAKHYAAEHYVRRAGGLCPNCGKDYFVEETIVDGELCCSCACRQHKPSAAGRV